MKKIRIEAILMSLLAFLLSSCEKDNYEPPTTFFTGQLTYNGKPFLFNGNTDTGEGSDIIQLFQDGFGKTGPMSVRVNQDGHFSALLFDGEYKMTFANQNYPFTFEDWPMRADGKPDTLKFDLQGGKEMEIKVKPYFEINDIEYKVGFTNIEASFNIAEVMPGAKVEKAYIYMSTAINVNKSTKVNQSVEVTDISQPIDIKVPLSSYRNMYTNNYRDYAYVRIAIKTDKADEFLWSPVQKIENLPASSKTEDITKLHLKNPGPIFEQLPGSAAKGRDQWDNMCETPAGWTVNSGVLIYADKNGKKWGGLDTRWDRDWLSVTNFDFAESLTVRNGKVYQHIKLPAGKYLFSAKFGEAQGRIGFSAPWTYHNTEHCYMVVNKGDGALPDWDKKETALAITDIGDNSTNAPTAMMEFELTEETEIGIGFLYDFGEITTDPAKFVRCAYAFQYVTLERILPANEE